MRPALGQFETIYTNITRIDLFFSRVQPSIPLFHEPRFRRKFQVGGLSNERYARLSLEDALTLTAMMALSARFSSNEFFQSPIPRDKGKVFARKATALYTQALQSDDQAEELTENSLAFLQGCILLAFYEQTNRITTQSWLLIGTCSRLAIDLGLNEIDKNIKMITAPGEQYSAESWTLEEEKRRAWWLVWELDVFAATILRRPHAFNKDQMHVLLPVSDNLWFSETPAESTSLQTDALHTWQTLENYPNADERTWFLVTTFLMARAADFACPERNTTSQDILNFESTLNCFALLLPQSFQLDFVRAPFNEGTFAANNWALLTVFMLHTFVQIPSMLHEPSDTDSLPLVPASWSEMRCIRNRGMARRILLILQHRYRLGRTMIPTLFSAPCKPGLPNISSTPVLLFPVPSSVQLLTTFALHSCSNLEIMAIICQC